MSDLSLHEHIRRIQEGLTELAVHTNPTDGRCGCQYSQKDFEGMENNGRLLAVDELFGIWLTRQREFPGWERLGRE